MVFKNMYNCDNCLDFPDRCILLGFLPSLRQSSAISGVINNQGDNQYNRCYFPQKCKQRLKISAKISPEGNFFFDGGRSKEKLWKV